MPAITEQEMFEKFMQTLGGNLTVHLSNQTRTSVLGMFSQTNVVNQSSSGLVSSSSPKLGSSDSE